MAWDEKSQIVLLDPEKNTKENFFTSSKLPNLEDEGQIHI